MFLNNKLYLKTCVTKILYLFTYDKILRDIARKRQIMYVCSCPAFIFVVIFPWYIVMLKRTGQN